MGIPSVPCVVYAVHITVSVMLCRVQYCQGKLSPVYPSVCKVEVSWSHILEYSENNFTAD